MDGSSESKLRIGMGVIWFTKQLSTNEDFSDLDASMNTVYDSYATPYGSPSNAVFVVGSDVTPCPSPRRFGQLMEYG